MAKKLRDFQGPSSFILPESDIKTPLQPTNEPVPPIIQPIEKPISSVITLDDILFKPAVHHRDDTNKFVGAYIPEKYHNILKELSNSSGIPAKFIIANILANFLESDGRISLISDIEKLRSKK